MFLLRKKGEFYFIIIVKKTKVRHFQGSWGTGKTSIMNLVKQQLPNDVFPVWFNTWQFSQFNMSEELPVSLLERRSEPGICGSNQSQSETVYELSAP